MSIEVEFESECENISRSNKEKLWEIIELKLLIEWNIVPNVMTSLKELTKHSGDGEFKKHLLNSFLGMKVHRESSALNRDDW